MFASTYNAGPIFVLPYGPDWSHGVDLSVSVPSDRSRGQTGREERRALGHTLRCLMDWKARLDRAKANALRTALEQIGGTPVVTPAWPFAMPFEGWSSAPVSGGLVLAWTKGWATWTLTTPGALAGTWDFVAPALWGFLEADSGKSDGADAVNVRFRFEEDGPAGYALAPAAQSWTSGPALNDGATPPVFPFRVDWNNGPKPGLPELQVDREKSGPARESAVTFYPQFSERPQDGMIALTNRAQVGRFLSWWQSVRGAVGSHMVTTLTTVTTLALDAAAGTSSLTVADGSALGGPRLVELRSGSGSEVVRVTAVSGNTLTLSAPLSRGWNAATTGISLAMLARHSKSTVDLRFIGPNLAQVRVAWREVAAEVWPAVGETRGSTIGAQPVPAWLYEITEDFGGGVTAVHRATNHERTVTAASHSWTSRPGLSHGEIRRSLRLDRDEVTLKGRWWDGCPFAQFLPGRLAALVRLAIYECSVDNVGVGTGLAQKFGGEVTKCPFDGPEFSASASGMYALFDRPSLAYRVQRTCNATVFSPMCGLVEADWAFTATVVSVSGVQLQLGTFVRTGGLPAGFGFAHWFALGYAQRTVGGFPQRFAIAGSTALDGSGRIVLTLDRPVVPAPSAGDSWTVVPGCDGRAVTCKAWDIGTNPQGKFGWFSNFKGFDEMPDKDPAFQPLKSSSSTAGKK